MSDQLYDHDFPLWTERQAALLGRLRRGERVTDIDWDNLIEEVEALGRSETRAVQSLVLRALEHLLKAAGWPASPYTEHWQDEAGVFLRDARREWAPSMTRHIDVAELYAAALARVLRLRMHDSAPGPLPEACPFTLADLLPAEPTGFPDVAPLVARLRG
jgi:hypothetical protein